MRKSTTAAWLAAAASANATAAASANATAVAFITSAKTLPRCGSVQLAMSDYGTSVRDRVNVDLDGEEVHLLPSVGLRWLERDASHPA